MHAYIPPPATAPLYAPCTLLLACVYCTLCPAARTAAGTAGQRVRTGAADLYAVDPHLPKNKMNTLRKKCFG